MRGRPTFQDIPPTMDRDALLYRRVLVRRRDLFGEVVDFSGDDPLVKLEWPWDPDAEPEAFACAELQLVVEAVAETAQENHIFRPLVSPDQIPTDRRFAWLSISDVIFVEILKGFHPGGLRAFTVTEHALPLDARAIGYRFTGPAGTISLLLHSESFPIADTDQEKAPILPTPLLRVVEAALPKRQDRKPK